MATEFAFEHIYRAPSIAAVFAATFDPDNVARQDRVAGIARRDQLELIDDAATFRRVCVIVPTRQLPAFVRPFISGELSVHETILWHKTDNFLTIEVQPSLLGGKAHVSSGYRLTFDGNNAVRRDYKGTATVGVPLVGGRIERALIDDMRSSLGLTATVTQETLDSRASQAGRTP